MRILAPCPSDIALTPLFADIRTLFVLLLLSFVDAATPASVKSAFLEQRKDIFSSTFRGLWQDPYSVVRRVLEVCWVGVWSDPKVKRTLKVQVFNETVLAQVCLFHVQSGSAMSETVVISLCDRVHSEPQANTPHAGS